MAIQTCSECGTHLAWGLFRCPRCGEIAPMYAEAARLIKKGMRTMPRITAAGGPSNAGAVEGEVGFIKREERKAAEVVAEVEADVRAAEDWASKTVAHLRKAAEERGLSASGSKSDLAARLAEHEAKAAAAETAPAADPAPEAAPAETAEDAAKAK